MTSFRARSLFFSVIVSVGVIFAFIYYLYYNADKYLNLLRMSLGGVLLLFLVSLTFPLLNGLQNVYLYRRLGAAISYREGLFLTAASTLANQLPVSGGIISKGVYLNYKYKMSYVHFASSTLALYLYFISTNGFIGFTTLLVYVCFTNVSNSSALLVAYLLMTCSILFFRMPLPKITLPAKMHIWIRQAEEGLSFVNADCFVLMKIIILQVALIFLLAFRYWLAFHMLSQDVTMGYSLLFASATILTQLVSIAPGGLGVREAIVGAVAALLGVDPAISMIAVGLDRLVSTVMIILTGWIGMLALGRQLTESGLSDK